MMFSRFEDQQVRADALLKIDCYRDEQPQPFGSKGIRKFIF